MLNVAPQMHSDLTQIEEKFLRFAATHAVGADIKSAMREGAFAVYPEAGTPDLFGAIDFAYAAFILNRLDDITDRQGRLDWATRILKYQDDDGWFRSKDKQKHRVEHATAYALGALQILMPNHDILKSLKPLTGLQQTIHRHPSRLQAPFSLSMLDRVHFWRGSHRAGGIPAIIGSIMEMGLSGRELLDIDNLQTWLQGWWDYFSSRLDPKTGYWRLAPFPLQMGFDLLYQKRHNPTLAAMGGAVHLYWVSERMKAPMPYPSQTIEATAALLPENGLYEKEPYCIDLDANFMIGRASSVLPPQAPAQAIAHKALLKNRQAVVEWYMSREPEQWNKSAHKLPGAFAAVAEADRILQKDTLPRWRDVFETTWWL